MTSHGWMLLSLMLTLFLGAAFFFTDTRTVPVWVFWYHVGAAVLRLIALWQLAKLRWRGVLLGLVPSAMGVVFGVGDNLGLWGLEPPSVTTRGLNWGMAALSAVYFPAAWSARTRRPGAREDVSPREAE